jgi:hypothetical protein
MVDQTGEQMVETEGTARIRTRVRPLSARAFLGIVGVVFLTCFALTLALPHDTAIRYRSFQDTIFDRLGWIYDRIANDPTPIDVLVIGPSREARGVNADYVQQALAARGVEASIANLSIPAAGVDWQISVLRETLKHHPEVKLVIWGVVEALPRDGHQAFADLATPGEILSSPWLINRNLPGDIAQLPYRQMELALATELPDAFELSRDFDPAAYPGPRPDHRLFSAPDFDPETDRAQNSTPEHAEALVRESRNRHREITPPVLPGPLQRFEFGVSRHYIRELGKLARAHDFEVAFLFLPFFDGYPDAIEADWLAERGAYWGAGFLRDDPDNFGDAAHLSQTGMEALTPWLADRIAEELKGKE